MKMRLLLAHLRGIARRLAMHVVSGSRAMPIPPIRMGNAGSGGYLRGQRDVEQLNCLFEVFHTL